MGTNSGILYGSGYLKVGMPDILQFGAQRILTSEVKWTPYEHLLGSALELFPKNCDNPSPLQALGKLEGWFTVDQPFVGTSYTHKEKPNRHFWDQPNPDCDTGLVAG